ncbi:MAG: DUF3179 domain-containing protein [Candidatus Marinimicrobia bacterium]|nr:DUF3179 domain-containing protein [Candidatus Neomarinimicrobiota bacterium]
MFRPKPFFLMIVLGLGLMLGGCDRIFSSRDRGGVPGGLWLIPVDEVFGGGPGKDGIPAISNPQFAAAKDVGFLADNSLVVGVKVGAETRAYPHLILDWHEIVNDQISSSNYALTYCPLTGSAISWNRTIGGQTTTFGVSGLLYNTNLIPYDRASGSNWSQMRLLCVQGENIGSAVEIFPIVETTWKTWREMYPETKVMTTSTGYSRSYGAYPYGSYRSDRSLLFPISDSDDRLHPKERVAGLIVDDQAKVYRLGTFAAGDTVRVINDEFKGIPIVVAGSEKSNVIVIFQRSLPDSTVLSFTPLQQVLPVVMLDNEGTSWDLFGRAVAGPRAGAQLPITRSYIAYWFAWGTFFTGVEIYSD